MRSLSSTKETLIGVAALTACIAGSASSQQTRSAIPVSACPAELVVAQTATSIAGWKAERASDVTGRLQGMGFYDGPVAQGAQLRPNGLRKRGQITVSESDFDGHLRPIHLACSYMGTDIILSRPLPANVRRCTITRDAMKPAEVDSVLVCR